MPKSSEIKLENIKNYWKKINSNGQKIIINAAGAIKNIYDKNKNNNLEINNSYKKSYDSLIKQGKKCSDERSKDRFDELVVLAHAAYGWMPTILEIGFEFDGEKKKEIINAVNHLSSFDSSSFEGDKFFEKTFNSLKTIDIFTNNSFVGASKFLHFIYPERFAIFDSKIFDVLQNNQASNLFAVQNVNDMRNFIGYQLAMQKAKEKLKNEVNLRRIESVLFDSAKD